MTLRWSVQVTTAPRQVDYLSDTLHSLDCAGWAEAATIHNDEDRRLGSWGNLQRALKAAAEVDPDVALFLQDDCLLSDNTREYLEAVLPGQPWWGNGKLGCLSLYLNEATSRKLKPGFSIAPMELMGQWGGGAVAFLMPRESLQAIAANPPWPQSYHLSEIWLQSFCATNKLIWVDHCPSLVRHLGRVSALKVIPNERQPRPEPAWSEWRHESDWCQNALSLIPKSAQPESKPVPKKTAKTALF